MTAVAIMGLTMRELWGFQEYNALMHSQIKTIMLKHTS